MAKEVAKVKKSIRTKAMAPACGLCGKKKKLREQTDCCHNWICSDENDYVLFSYARNSCSRNHRRFTICGHHKSEEHKGAWQKCKKCLNDFHHELEMYVWYATNEYNFEKLENPPKFHRTHCAGCDKILRLPNGGFTSLGDIYVCADCMECGFDIRAAAGVDPIRS
jgi:hypothetical protein